MKVELNDNNYFDHDADIGIKGYGDTLEAAFIQAAAAVFAIMADIKKIKPVTTVKIEFTENDPELAFITWLNLLIGEARAHKLVFCQFELTHEQDSWRGIACGDKWSEKTVRGVEVKGATLTMLSVKQINQHWQAQCIVDV